MYCFLEIGRSPPSWLITRLPGKKCIMWNLWVKYCVVGLVRNTLTLPGGALANDDRRATAVYSVHSYLIRHLAHDPSAKHSDLWQNWWAAPDSAFPGFIPSHALVLLELNCDRWGFNGGYTKGSRARPLLFNTAEYILPPPPLVGALPEVL